jgi:hypothetical protein
VGQLIDSSGDIYQISTSRQVSENGKVDDNTSNVDALTLVKGVIWEQVVTSSGPQWLKKVGDSWVAGSNPLTPSSAGSNTTANIGPHPGILVDDKGDLWWVVNGHAVENGKADSSSSVVALHSDGHSIVPTIDDHGGSSGSSGGSGSSSNGGGSSSSDNSNNGGTTVDQHGGSSGGSGASGSSSNGGGSSSSSSNGGTTVDQHGGGSGGGSGNSGSHDSDGGGSSGSGSGGHDDTPNYGYTDTSISQSGVFAGDAYQGPVAGLQSECIYLTSDNINLSANVSNVFLHSGSGNDALQVLGGTNVLDGGTGSNFLTGGSGHDTYFVDDRGPDSDIWSTLVNFHAGDDATVWGVTSQDFKFDWVDNQGAAGFTGLTMHATAAGHPTASLTLAGYSSDDLHNGRLSVSFGHTDDQPGVPGSSYMVIHGS